MLCGGWGDEDSYLLFGVMRMWPLKVGELLASMHVYGTLNYANSLVDFTQPSFSVYGILIVRTIGCILVKMFVSSNGCQVSVLHEGGSAQVGHWSISQIASLHDYQISFHTLSRVIVSVVFHGLPFMTTR